MIRLIKRIIKECFWLICSVVIIVLGWSLFFLAASKKGNFGKLWDSILQRNIEPAIKFWIEIIQGDSLALTLVLIPLAIIYLVRVIAWFR
jgi:hypothetical protein